MILRGDVSSVRFPHQTTSHLAKEEEILEIAPFVRQFCELFGYDAETILQSPYTVVTPDSKNPYQQMYVAN